MFIFFRTYFIKCKVYVIVFLVDDNIDIVLKINLLQKILWKYKTKIVKQKQK